MPKDSQDVETARELVSLGPASIAPVVHDMLRHLKDLQSPVAKIYWEFFARHGEPLAGEVAKFLRQAGMEYQKYVIVGWILPAWSRDAIRSCEGPLSQLVTTNSGAFDTDLRSIQLLAKHELAEREWLRGWLNFKREAFARLTNELEQIAGGL